MMMLLDEPVRHEANRQRAPIECDVYDNPVKLHQPGCLQSGRTRRKWLRPRRDGSAGGQARRQSLLDVQSHVGGSTGRPLRRWRRAPHAPGTSHVPGRPVPHTAWSVHRCVLSRPCARPVRRGEPPPSTAGTHPRPMSRSQTHQAGRPRPAAASAEPAAGSRLSAWPASPTRMVGTGPGGGRHE